MKIKTIIIMVILVFICNFSYSDDKITIKNYTSFPNKIRVYQDKTADEIGTYTFEEYIKGVVQGEIAAITILNITTNTNNYQIKRKEVYKTLCLSAMSYIITQLNYYKNENSPSKWKIGGTGELGYWIDPSDNKKYPKVRSHTDFHVFDKYKKGDYPEIEEAYNAIKDKAIYYNADIIRSTYFSSSHDYFTKNSEDYQETSDTWWTYYRNTRSQPTLETDPSGGSGGHGVGLSQFGTIFYAKAGKTYQQILEHYYSPIPPYLKRLTIVELESGETKENYGSYIDGQNGYALKNIVYQGEWIKESDRSGRKFILKVKKDISPDRNIILILDYGEDIINGHNQYVSIMDKNSNVKSSGSSLRSGFNNPFETWEKKQRIAERRFAYFSKDKIQGLFGEYILRVSAQYAGHNTSNAGNNAWNLDIDPSTIIYHDIAQGKINDTNYESDISHTKGGYDICHKINIGNTPQIFDYSPKNNFYGNRINFQVSLSEKYKNIKNVFVLYKSSISNNNYTEISLHQGYYGESGWYRNVFTGYLYNISSGGSAGTV